MITSAEQKKQYLNSWLEEKGIVHELNQASALAKFEDLATANGWDGEYIEEKKDDEEGHKFEGENPTFKMRYAGIINMRNGDVFSYKLEDPTQLEAFKVAKASDAKMRKNYKNNAKAGEHWSWDYHGKSVTFEFIPEVGRLNVKKKLSAAIELSMSNLTVEDLDGLSENALRVALAKMKLESAVSRMTLAEI
jgi:hypothetical protein